MDPNKHHHSNVGKEQDDGYDARQEANVSRQYDSSGWNSNYEYNPDYDYDRDYDHDFH